MNLAIVGSRKYPDKSAVIEFVFSLPQNTVIISGGAIGVDSWAVRAAKNRGMEFKVFKPKKEEIIKYGFGRAAFNRNQKIVDNCDQLIAFWDGQSRGTIDTLKRAYRSGVSVTVNLELQPGLKMANVTKELTDIRDKYASMAI